MSSPSHFRCSLYSVFISSTSRSCIDEISVTFRLPPLFSLYISPVWIALRRDNHHTHAALHISSLHPLIVTIGIDKITVTLLLNRHIGTHRRTMLIAPRPLFLYFISHPKRIIYIPTNTSCLFDVITITLPSPSPN